MPALGQTAARLPASRPRAALRMAAQTPPPLPAPLWPATCPGLPRNALDGRAVAWRWLMRRALLLALALVASCNPTAAQLRGRAYGAMPRWPDARSPASARPSWRAWPRSTSLTSSAQDSASWRRRAPPASRMGHAREWRDAKRRPLGLAGDLGRILTAAANAKLAADAERERVRAEEAAKSAAAMESCASLRRERVRRLPDASPGSHHRLDSRRPRPQLQAGRYLGQVMGSRRGLC